MIKSNNILALNMSKRLRVILTSALLILTSHIGLPTAAKIENQPQPVKIVASIQPIANIVKAIALPNADIQVLVNTGTSPHAFTLSPSQIQALHRADSVIFNSRNLESFLSKHLHHIPQHKQIELLQLPDIKTLPLRHTHHHCHHHDHNHEHGKPLNTIDPHIWLSPFNAKLIAKNIKQKLSQLDPNNKATYQQHFENFVTNVDNADALIYKKLAHVKHKSFLLAHDAYQYFNEHYGLKQTYALTFNPDLPLSAKQASIVSNLVLEKKIHCAFYEPQFKPKMLVQIAQQNKLKLGSLDPLGRPEQSYVEFLTNLADNLSLCLSE